MRNAVVVAGCALLISLAAGLARAELPAPPDAAADLNFREFFALPIGPKGLVPSARLLGLDGRRVRIVGYMVKQEEPTAGLLIAAVTYFPIFKMLTEAANRLAPDGILLIAAPNPLSWQARVLGRRWVHHDLPRHLFGLSIPWVLGFAEKAGLRPELVTTRDEGSLYWNHFTWAMLASRLSPHPRLTPRIWNLGIRFGRAIEFWEGREGQGATYTVVLRRAG